MVPVVLQVPFCDEKSVQLVRHASFRSDFLQNPYFSNNHLMFQATYNTLLPTAFAVRCVFVLFNTVKQSEKFFSLEKKKE